jgi:hypothetical protein
MKRFCLTLLILVSAVSLANAQIIRSSGVVKKTRVSVEREKTEKVKTNETYSWQNEVGRITHSAGVVIGSDFDMLMLMADYNAQYRFSPLLSAGGGIWAGWWWPFGILSIGHVGFEPRVNIRIHPLAESHPNSPFQPYASLNLGTLLPPFEVDGGNYGYGVDSWAILTGEIGCDWYHKGRTLFASININSFHEYEWGEGEYSYNNDWDILSLMFKIGVRF